MVSRAFEMVFWFRDRFVLLLVSLVGVLMTIPALEDPDNSSLLDEIVFNIGLAAIVLTGVVANRERRVLFWIGGALGGLVILSSLSATWLDRNEVSLARCLFIALFCGMYALMILVTVARDHMATMGAVEGGVCAYLLMGLGWAFLYASLEYYQDSPLDIPYRRLVPAERIEGYPHTATSQLIYFSFVTMSTLGYGDITPRTAVAETLTWMQSVVGQMYLAIFIARAINLVTPRDPPGARRDKSNRDSVEN